jgi:hypothetical protein
VIVRAAPKPILLAQSQNAYRDVSHLLFAIRNSITPTPRRRRFFPCGENKRGRR